MSCWLLGSGFATSAEPGKAVGSFTFDSTTVPLAYAVETRVEGLFDSSKQDTLVVLTDKPLGTTAPAMTSTYRYARAKARSRR
jgi:hypothetical protein